MDDSIKQVEKYATDTAGITDAVRQDAERGKEAVEATITGICEIRRSSQITSEVIATLSERVRDIGAILTVIDEVAEQTNLLALNAAIIAAQAGEHGKGFAVVADEIKQLAERTRSSTREIGQVIKGVQEGTLRAVEAIKKAEKSIADGEGLSANAGATLNRIVEEAQNASGQMAEIAQATEEQARSSQSIRDAMVQVADLVEQFAKASQEQAQGSEMIIAAVERMKDLSSQVRSSTQEQSKAGVLIARSTENITSMIQQIKRASDEQSRGSEQIVAAVENIQQSAQVNLDITATMNEAASSLARQVEILELEMQAFRV
jgi:methyl-accepting chemotaxis protein